MTLPFFSIIIPAVNEEKYLPSLLGDLANQSFRDFEVIVVDGKSDDQTVKKAKSFAHHLPHLKLVSSPRRHVCIQRNLGASKAQANWFIFLDADNRLPPHFLQGIKYRLELTTTDILTTRFQPDVNNSTNHAVANAINLFLELQNGLKPTYLLEAMIVIRKACFSQIGGFDETVRYAEGKSVVQAAVKANYRLHYARDPVWIYSFRRFRKYGLLGLASRAARMELSELLGLDPKRLKLTNLYPMEGGSFYEESKRQKLLANLQARLKSSTSLNNFSSRLQTILASLRED